MATRYCIQCGTLLPEDGVCLRCGAVYSFADDGSLVVHPRKVKNVTAKATPKRRAFAKRAMDPSEADTQTIPIPEDIFSYSDQSSYENRHQDWTGETEENKDPRFPEFDDFRKQDYDEEVPLPESQTKKPQKKKSGCGLAILFLIISFLTALFVYFAVSDNESEQSESSSQSTTTIVESQSTEPTTAKVVPHFSVKTLELKGMMIGDDRATYSFDKTNGRLDIYYSGHCPMGMILLPLIDGPNFSKKHLSLAILAKESNWDFDEYLCESDLITEGIIKEIKLHARGSDYPGESSYQFDITGGRLNKIYHTEEYPDSYGSNHFDYAEVDFSYDTSGRVISIEKSDEEDDSSIIKKFKYDKNGYLSEIYRKEVNEYYSKETTDTLKYSGKLLKSITPKGDFEENRTVTTFEYDENGFLSSMRLRSYDKFANEEYTFTISSAEEIVTIHVEGIEEEDTYSYLRGA